MTVNASVNTSLFKLLNDVSFTCSAISDSNFKIRWYQSRRATALSQLSILLSYPPGVVQGDTGRNSNTSLVKKNEIKLLPIRRMKDC